MGDSLNDALYLLTGARESIPLKSADEGQKELSSPKVGKSDEDGKLDQIRDSIGNIKIELDRIESLFQNLEEVIKGD